MVARDLSPNTWEPEVHARPMWPLLISFKKNQKKKKKKKTQKPPKNKKRL